MKTTHTQAHKAIYRTMNASNNRGGEGAEKAYLHRRSQWQHMENLKSLSQVVLVARSDSGVWHRTAAHTTCLRTPKDLERGETKKACTCTGTAKSHSILTPHKPSNKLDNQVGGHTVRWGVKTNQKYTRIRIAFITQRCGCVLNCSVPTVRQGQNEA